LDCSLRLDVLGTFCSTSSWRTIGSKWFASNSSPRNAVSAADGAFIVLSNPSAILLRVEPDFTRFVQRKWTIDNLVLTFSRGRCLATSSPSSYFVSATLSWGCSCSDETILTGGDINSESQSSNLSRRATLGVRHGYGASTILTITGSEHSSETSADSCAG
jgi:hypothetical protein